MKNKIYCAGGFSIEEEGKWQEIFRVGDWENSYKEFKVELPALFDMVANFKNNVLRLDKGELQVNFSHNSHKKAAGWIEDLKVENQKLLAKIRWTRAGRDSISGEEFKYFSAEIDFKYVDQETGVRTENVLLGAALTNIPFVRELQAVALSDMGKDESFIEREISYLSLANGEFFLSNFMTTFQKLADSLASKELLSSAEFQLLNVAFTALSEEEQAEAQETVEKLKEKVDANEGKELEEAKTELSELKAKLSEKENQIKTLSDEKGTDLTKLSENLAEAQTQLSAKQAELDKMKAEMRKGELTQKLSSLFEEGKLVGEKVVEKTTAMLMELSAEKAEGFITLLSSQPAKVNLGEAGGNGGDASDSSKAYELADAEAKKLSASTGKSYKECFSEIAPKFYK